MVNEEWKMRNEKLIYAFFQNAVNTNITLQYNPTLITHHSSLKTLKGGVFYAHDD